MMPAMTSVWPAPQLDRGLGLALLGGRNGDAADGEAALGRRFGHRGFDDEADDAVGLDASG